MDWSFHPPTEPEYVTRMSAPEARVIRRALEIAVAQTGPGYDGRALRLMHQRYEEMLREDPGEATVTSLPSVDRTQLVPDEGPVVTATGRELSDADLDELVEEAEHGYEVVGRIVNGGRFHFGPKAIRRLLKVQGTDAVDRRSAGRRGRVLDLQLQEGETAWCPDALAESFAGPCLVHYFEPEDGGLVTAAVVTPIRSR